MSDWLDEAVVRKWAGTDADAGGQPDAVVALATAAASQWVEDHRPDLMTDGVFHPGDSVTQGGVLLAVRLLGRVATGATPTLGLVGLAVAADPDVSTLLGLDRPAVG